MNPFLITFISIVLLIGVVSDLRFQRIPNVLAFPTMIAALAYHGVNGGSEGLLFSAKGLGLGVTLLLLPYMMGGMGAGDAKLMGAVGAVVGPAGVFIAFLFTAIFGGIYGLALLLARPEYLKEVIKRCWAVLKALVYGKQIIYIPPVKNHKKPRLCYGVAIAVGTICSIFWRLAGYTLLI
ncbi:MAG: prepilin peptidase [Proteobacteria bacterium]|nr:prepilin peptidase [Pseudomonadota bacterium]